MVAQQIPVIVIGGFLGSGKTTLLNHLLGASRGTRIGAIVNDFGSIEIDAMTVAGQVDSMVSLGNGCMCCAVDATELDEYLDRLARPSARIDVIVIEASGLAEPETLIRMILASGNQRIVYGGLVEVVDAAEFTATRERHPELDRHVRLADLVVLNKADRIAEEERLRLAETLGGLADGTPVVSASHGRVDPDLLFERRPRAEREAAVRQLSFDDVCSGVHDEHEHEPHIHAAYESVEFSSDTPMNPRRLMEFLDSRPQGLYRIKGFVLFAVTGHRQKFTLHAVGDFLRFYRSAWARGEARRTQLVMIGAGIDAEALRKELEACRESAPQDADGHSMWGVLRYVQS